MRLDEFMKAKDIVPHDFLRVLDIFEICDHVPCKECPYLIDGTMKCLLITAGDIEGIKVDGEFLNAARFRDMVKSKLSKCVASHVDIEANHDRRK